MSKKNSGGFHYRKKFKPNNGKKVDKKSKSTKQRQKLYTENWDDIRKKVYQRDGHRCVMCGKKGKLHAHHIVPVRVSHNNSLSNLISVCEKCHRRLEEVGFSILRNGGHQSDVRKIELQMIQEERQKRKRKYLEEKSKKSEDS